MSRKNKSHIYVQVLQNGSPIVETDGPISNRLKLSITSGLRGRLALPLYPLPAPIDLIRVQKNQCFLHIMTTFGGYYTSKGEVHDLQPHHHTEEQALMIHGDYASISLGDLRILIRIGDAPVLPPPVKKDRQYRGRWSSLAFDSSQERWSGFGAFCLAALFLIGISTGMQLHKNTRPEKFEDLAGTYTLPFIAPKNIASAPEALQNHLNRDKYVSSIVYYYRNLIRIISGTGGSSKLFFESVADKNKMFWKNYEQKRFEFIEQHEEEFAGLDPETHVQLRIPSITTLPIKSQAALVIRRLRAMHIAFDQNLKTRRKITKEFLKDGNYDWGLFSRKVQLKGISRKKKKKGGFGGGGNDEERMYSETKRLAAQAKSYQKGHSKVSTLHSQSLDYIRLEPSPTVTFLEQPHKTYDLNKLQASRYGQQQKIKILEPLIGEIRPAAILQAIEYRQLQLKLCYELALRRDHDVEGKMDWTWRIDTQGKPSEFHLKGSTIEDRQMIQCVRERLAQWTFPQPRYGSVLITHSFHFHPESDVSLQ